MSTIVKIHRKGRITLPSRLRAIVGIDDGDLVEASVKGGKIVLTPKLVIDRSRFPTADDDYTPAQRKSIDARLAKADEDIKKGRLLGPFAMAEEMIEFLHGQTKKKIVEVKTQSKR